MKPDTDRWKILEPDVASILAQYPRPLDALADGDTPALVIRGAYTTEACERLVETLIQRELLYDPASPIPEKFITSSIPEGYYREGSGKGEQWRQRTETGRRRIDIGTSLGYRGSDQEAFFQHSTETRTLFASLFSDEDNPVGLLYATLQQLSIDKQVVTAHEPDGRVYGPAIIRAHYGGYTYAPHFDSVRLREKRHNYAVHDFDHQFAGVLVLQNTCLEDQSAQCILHRCLWTPEVEPHLQNRTFHEYAEQRNIARTQVVLEPGDLYFFNTRAIHEVPGVAGEQPRIVLATFIGFSADRDEIFVWS